VERAEGKCVKPVSANDIDEVLRSSRDLSIRLRYWEASKETGPALKAGLAELQALRNRVARHFGFSSFHALQVADYGMTPKEMSAMMDGFLRDIAPLYAGLHCWAKHELANRYEEPVPERLIPAHWLGNRWAQNWTGLVEGVDLDPYFKNKTPEWIVQQAEAFYVSMGFPALPENFWKRSDLYPVPADGPRKKNTHASAWHVDIDQEVRSLMSVENNTYWFGTSHHELGHIYYFLAYSRPEIPVLLREGANRAFHEGIGELITIASMQVPYLRKTGLLPADARIDQQKWLLNEALDETVAFLPWSAGVMHAFERDLYETDLSSAAWNRRWWEYVERFQGVAPPSERGEQFCDACTKTHVNDDPAQYYDYAIATVVKYQLHDHICRKILNQDPHSCDYSGSREVGAFLKKLLSPGSSRDWRALLKELTGEELSTRPMMEYFKPLNDFLSRQNSGRTCAWKPQLAPISR
jgi:peptidyl-dipeptidase A